MDLDFRGFRGDRLFAICDRNGKIGSGKNTRRFCQIDGLLAFRASYTADWPEIVFPDGRCMRADDPKIDSALSETLSATVTLVREDQVSHFDAGAVHLVSTGALAWLKSRLPDSQTDERRFRPNIVISVPGNERTDSQWMGKHLRVGAEAVLDVTAQTERCRMIILKQADLPADARILRCIAQDADLQFGVYGAVLKPGRICVGDKVELESSSAA